MYHTNEPLKESEKVLTNIWLKILSTFLSKQKVSVACTEIIKLKNYP